MKLHEIPYVYLDDLNTPFYKLESLTSHLKGPEIFIKRDDMTGLGLGGNKIRKLEYLLADARSKGADWLITTGGIQSNHTRITGACARKAGMECAVILKGIEPEVHRGNLFLSDILGMEIHYLHPDLYFDKINEEMEKLAEKKRAEGHTPYLIPVGGATPLGSCGYIRFVEELAEQQKKMDIKLDTIVISLGACGTMAGILVGVDIFMPGTKVVGVSVSGTCEAAGNKVAAIATDAANMVGLDKQYKLDDLEIYDQYIGKAYGIPSPEAIDAIYLLARKEGIFLDPVYTGKGMSGLIDLVGKGRFVKGEKIMFLHTGGAPALFAYEDYFKKIY